MAGERHLAARVEDPHLRGVRRVLRRQDEGGFREVEFGGDGLHLPGRQALGVEDDRQRIAQELRAGEHVDGLELQAHRTSAGTYRVRGRRGREPADLGVAAQGTMGH